MAYAGYTELPKGGNILHMTQLRRAGDGAMQHAADLYRCHGGIMRIGRAIIIPAILALSVSGSILASSAAPAVAAQAPTAHVLSVSSYAGPHTYYHW
jgi:hypothetical protein